VIFGTQKGVYKVAFWMKKFNIYRYKSMEGYLEEKGIMETKKKTLAVDLSLSVPLSSPLHCPSAWCSMP
jgi:hypothetical protein